MNSNCVPLPDAEPACYFKSLSSWKSLTAYFTGVATYAHNSRDQRRQQKEFGQAAHGGVLLLWQNFECFLTSGSL